VFLPPQGTWDVKAFLDLDTGEKLARFEGYRPTGERHEFWKWVAQAGVDAYAAGYFITEDGERPLRLQGYDTVVWPVSNERWSTFERELRSSDGIELGWAKSNFTPFLTESPRYPATFLFTTAGGARGILQIVQSSQDPRGLLLRYRLVKKTNWSGFSAEIERTLNLPDAESDSVIDLDTGRLGTPSPDAPRDKPYYIQFLKWVSHSQYDGYAATVKDTNRAAGIWAPDMVVLEVSPSLWGTLTAEQARQMLWRGLPQDSAPMAGEGRVYLFKTAEGSMGILKIAELLADPARVRFRYRLIERATTQAAAGSTTPLHEAAARAHDETAEALIQTGADVNARDEQGRTPLHLAAAGGRQATVELLLRRGAQINAEDDAGRTPLHEAATGGHPQLVRFLIARGAKTAAAGMPAVQPSASDARRELAERRIAVEQRKLKNIKLLLAAGRAWQIEVLEQELKVREAKTNLVEQMRGVDSEAAAEARLELARCRLEVAVKRLSLPRPLVTEGQASPTELAEQELKVQEAKLRLAELTKVAADEPATQAAPRLREARGPR